MCCKAHLQNPDNSSLDPCAGFKSGLWGKNIFIYLSLAACLLPPIGCSMHSVGYASCIYLSIGADFVWTQWQLHNITGSETHHDTPTVYLAIMSSCHCQSSESLSSAGRCIANSPIHATVYYKILIIQTDLVSVAHCFVCRARGEAEQVSVFPCTCTMLVSAWGSC